MDYDKTLFKIPDIFLLNEIVLWMMVKKARGIKVLIYRSGREANKNRS